MTNEKKPLFDCGEAERLMATSFSSLPNARQNSSLSNRGSGPSPSGGEGRRIIEARREKSEELGPARHWAQGCPSFKKNNLQATSTNEATPPLRQVASK